MKAFLSNRENRIGLGAVLIVLGGALLCVPALIPLGVVLIIVGFFTSFVSYLSL